MVYIFGIFVLFPIIVLSIDDPPNIWAIHSEGHDVKVLTDIPNSDIMLRKEMEKVELVCTANYPIKWDYLYKNISVPILEKKYRRIAPNLTDFSNTTFVSTVTLRNLKEYQTGKYVCRYFNRRFENNSYDISSYFHIFVPGKRVINEISHVQFVSNCDLPIVIRCPVSDPEKKIKLFKLNEIVFNKNKEIKWRPLYPSYDPTQGFILRPGLGRIMLGTYNCTSTDNTSIISIIADVEEKNHYNESLNECWGDINFMKLVRSKRLECYCKNSYGLFVNGNFSEENRKSHCDNWTIPERCSDWRIQEFFDSGEDTEKSCYFDARPFNGTGSRAEMMATKKEYMEAGKWMTNISVIFNGFPSWASGSQLAIRRKSHQVQHIDVVSQDPTFETYFPLAQNRAGWTNISVEGNDIMSVHVYQPDSLSYDWFQLSTDIFHDSLEMDQSTVHHHTTETWNFSTASSILANHQLAYLFSIEVLIVLLLHIMYNLES